MLRVNGMMLSFVLRVALLADAKQVNVDVLTKDSSRASIVDCCMVLNENKQKSILKGRKTKIKS